MGTFMNDLSQLGWEVGVGVVHTFVFKFVFPPEIAKDWLFKLRTFINIIGPTITYCDCAELGTFTVS